MNKLFQSLSKHKYYVESWRIHQFISSRFLSEIRPESQKNSDEYHFTPVSDTQEVKDETASAVQPAKKKTKLLKIPSSQAKDIREIASFVIGFHEIATVTMTRDLVITSWDSVDFPKYSKKSVERLSQYNRIVHKTVSRIPDWQNIDLFIIENRYFRTSGHVRLSHFLIVKAMLHCLLSQGLEGKDSKIAYAQWIKTGRILDIAINSSTRKSGKEKVTEIFTDDCWENRPIIPYNNLAYCTEQGVRVRNYDNGNSLSYRPLTEEMADALLQALAFWSTL